MSESLVGTSFYFIRHGQSQANEDGVPAGTSDSPLTKQGEAEAEALRPIVEALAVPPSVIITSNLQRAKHTAAIVNTVLRLPMREEPSLAEQHYGDCQGVSKDVLNARYGTDWSRNPANGESFAAFSGRIVNALETILPTCPGIPLIVGHGGMAHVLGQRYGVTLRGVKNCTFLHFNADTVDSWSVKDHAGMPFSTGNPNMDHI